jgi:hypothetical protein
MQGFSIALGNGGKFLKKQQQFYFKKNTHKSIENKKPGNQHRQRNRGMQPLNNLRTSQIHYNMHAAHHQNNNQALKRIKKTNWN